MTSAIDTEDEVTTALEFAREAQQRGDVEAAVPLLEALRDSTLVVGEHWTEVRYRLGLIRWNEGDLATARDLMDQASVGQGDHAAHAAAGVAELDRQVAADGSTEGGVTVEEADAVINAAGDALLRGDHEVALALYDKAWNTPGLESLRLDTVALGRAQCLMAVARYAEAKEWFGWLKANGDAMYTADADAGLAELTRREAAEAAAADGGQVGELPDLWDAATEAFDRGDAAAALHLYTTVLENPTMRIEQRAGGLLNIGQCHFRLGDEELARAYFLQVLGLSAGERFDEWANERLDMLDRRDAALQAAGVVAVPE